MLGKITRIFLKSLGILFLLCFLTTTVLFFVVQSYGFQTWLGQRVSSYLSSELNSTISISKIELDFFQKAKLSKVLVLDLHRDTLLNGDLEVYVRDFSFRNKKLTIQRIHLKQLKAKLIQYKNTNSFNYQFLVDYFAAPIADSTTVSDWKINYNDITFSDVSFLFKNENKTTKIDSTINFNNLFCSRTSGTISAFNYNEDSLTLKFKNISTTEQSGFRLVSLYSQVKIKGSSVYLNELRLKTAQSLLKGNFMFKATDWNDYSDFMFKVKMDALIDDSTYVNFKDIASFSSELLGLQQTVKLSGKVIGTVNDLNLRDFKLAFGNQTRFNGSLSISGLPDFSTSYVHFNAKEISSCYSDIAKIPLYPFKNGLYPELPLELKNLGTVRYKGKFDGFVNDFTSYGKFTTALGSISTQLSVKLGKTLADIEYDGKLNSLNFNLGTLLGQNDLNALSVDCKVKGKGLTVNSMETDFEGLINSITYNNYNYHNIRLNGGFSKKIFSGLMVSQDPNADFDFNGTIDFTNKVPQMDFISTLTGIRLNELNFTSKADSGKLSSQIFITINGDNIDNLSGQINFDNTTYKTLTKTYKLSSFNLNLDQAKDEKSISLSSEYLNASLQGNYKLSQLKSSVEGILFYYYPSYFKKSLSTKPPNSELNFAVTFKKFTTIKELFIPELMLSNGTKMNGNMSTSTKKLSFNIQSGLLSYQSFKINNLDLKLDEENQTVKSTLTSRQITIGDSLSLENFSTSINSIDQNSDYIIQWNNFKQPVSKGEIAGRIHYYNPVFSLNNDKLSITVTDSTWTLQEPNSLSLELTKFLKVSPLKITNNSQLIEVSGVLSEQVNDSLVVHLEKVMLQQFNPLLKLFKLKLEGQMQGHVALSNTGKVFASNGHLSFKDFKLNENPLGELIINTHYATDEKHIAINGYSSLGLTDQEGNQIKNIAFNGLYHLDKKTESLDINFSANPANLKLLNPFLEGILTIKNAYVNGSGKIHGTPDHLLIDGKLRLFNSEIKVDYTNVSYHLTGDIEIMPDQIRFSDLLMREKGSKAAPQGTVNGNIFHTNFNRIQLDYDISYKNMLVLNTTEKENKLFYGRVYGSGNAGVYGFLNNLTMQITDTTTKNSKFILPLDGPSEIDEEDFITFVKKDTSLVKKETSLTGFNLDLSIHATPAASVQIILDKRNGDVLNVQGQGDLKININTLGKFNMYGNYFISDGDYLFTLENIINKKFDIDAGSSISWSGNPMNAEINVSTSYKQRVSVAPLLNDTTGQYKGRYPVDCKLLITGKLFTPIINFAIDFPSLDATAKARINNVLSDEMELNRQVFSFLLFRSFVTPAIFNINGGGVTASGAAASTGSEMLSNRVSEFLNTYLGNFSALKDLQLGLNYRPGSQNNTQAVDLALSKQFFNNRVSVDGNFGVNNNQNRSSNNVIGDVNIEYKLSDDGRFKLRAFNRSNDNTQIATTGGPYTQGIGFFYRKEFETFLKRKTKNK